MPIPKPNTGEERDAFIGRCMDNDVMTSEYPENDQRRAVCETAWKGTAENSKAFIQFAKGSKSLTVEIFAVGRWNGLDFTLDDLKLMAAAFSALKEVHKVPLKFGHNEEQPFTDGQPALGWVDDVYVSGDKLLADFVDIPEVVYTAMQSKLYRHVSVELDMGVEHKGSYYPWVLSGVALLGADIPAVNTLADLTAYMGKELPFKKRVAFTATEHNPEPRRTRMSNTIEERLATLEASIKAKDAEIERLINRNTQLEKDSMQMKADFKAMESAEAERKQTEERSLLATRLDNMVKEKKIAPFTRDEFLRDYDDAQDKSSVKFAVEKLEKTIDANPAYFGAEQARKKAKQQEEEDELSADKVVVQRTREYMAKHGEKNFSVAKQQVLRADTELANRYAKMEG